MSTVLGLSLTATEVVWALVDVSDGTVLDHDALEWEAGAAIAGTAARGARSIANADGVDVDRVRLIWTPAVAAAGRRLEIELRSLGFDAVEAVPWHCATRVLVKPEESDMPARVVLAYGAAMAVIDPSEAFTVPLRAQDAPRPRRRPARVLAAAIGVVAAAAVGAVFVSAGSPPQVEPAAAAAEQPASDPGWVSVTAPGTAAEPLRKVVNADAAPPLRRAAAAVPAWTPPAGTPVASAATPAAVPHLPVAGQQHLPGAQPAAVPLPGPEPSVPASSAGSRGVHPRHSAGSRGVRAGSSARPGTARGASSTRPGPVRRGAAAGPGDDSSGESVHCAALTAYGRVVTAVSQAIRAGEQVVETARGMRDLVREQAAESERQRTLTPAIVDAMWSTGLMSAFNPVPAGGVEPSFAEMIETWIEMAWQDGSFGWVGIANLPSAFAAAAYLPDAGFAEVFTANDNRVTMGGQFFPNGQGIAVDGGYRLTGSWSFGSGTGHSEYVAAGFLPMVDGEMRWVSEGVPDMQVAVVPRDEVTFTDGWFVQGLKGTGSYDYSVDDVFVPEHRTFALFTREPKRGTSPATRMGLMPITAAGHAAWALGVAKSMLDDVAELAATKYRMSDMAALANRPTFQKGLAHHVAAWRAARLLVLDAFTTAEARRRGRRGPDPDAAGGHARGRRLRHRYGAGVRRVGAPGRRHQRDPGGQPPRAGVPRHLHRHPARLHQREGRDRRRAGVARHRRGPVRALTSASRGKARPQSLSEDGVE